MTVYRHFIANIEVIGKFDKNDFFQYVDSAFWLYDKKKILNTLEKSWIFNFWRTVLVLKIRAFENYLNSKTYCHHESGHWSNSLYSVSNLNCLYFIWNQSDKILRQLLMNPEISFNYAKLSDAGIISKFFIVTFDKNLLTKNFFSIMKLSEN